MRKPTIGVAPLWDGERDSIWMLPGYLDAIREAGGVAVIFPLKCSEEDILQLCEMCDGFLLTGGDDVNPELYGAVPSERCGKPNHDRDYLEREIFNYAVQRDLPLFGICRGIQFINAICGGTLYQDLPTEYSHPSGISHQMTPPYDKITHYVDVVEQTPLAQLLSGATRLGVNSYHHQAVRELAQSLRAMAISEDGLIEAIYMPNKRFIQAVQWHPEFNFHCAESSRKLMHSFVKSCAESI